VRTSMAIGAATALLIVLPATGLVGGSYAGLQWAKPAGSVCGMYAWISLLAIGTGALSGLAVGAGVAWVAVRLVFRWANGCGLADVRDDEPFPGDDPNPSV
jgi:hypothetical protein